MKNIVNIYVIHSKIVKDNFSLLLNYIDQNRREKSLKYIYEKDKLLSIGSSYLLKKYLNNGQIKETPNGKPYIENGPLFNLSHSGEYSVLAIHPLKEIGVDIERIDINKLDAIKYTLSEEEKNELNPETLFRMWSNKESLIKCIGSSLNDIKKVPGLPLSGERSLHGNKYFTKSLNYDGYSLSVTLSGNEEFDILINKVEKIEVF